MTQCEFTADEIAKGFSDLQWKNAILIDPNAQVDVARALKNPLGENVRFKFKEVFWEHKNKNQSYGRGKNKTKATGAKTTPNWRAGRDFAARPFRKLPPESIRINFSFSIRINKIV